MRALVFLLSIVTAFSDVRGDEPVPPPKKKVTLSPSGRIRAVSDPLAKITRVEDAKSHEVLWSLPDYHRIFFVTDDGRHLITEYYGGNLIPTGIIGHLVLLTFWENGKKIREVRVRDLFPKRSILQHTASHYLWCQSVGLDEHGRLKVERVDHQIFLFDVATGKQVRPNQTMNSIAPSRNQLAVIVAAAWSELSLSR